MSAQIWEIYILCLWSELLALPSSSRKLDLNTRGFQRGMSFWDHSPCSGKAQPNMQTQRGTGLCRSRVHSWHWQLAWPATTMHTWPRGKTLWEKNRPLLQAGFLSVFSFDADRHSVFFRGQVTWLTASPGAQILKEGPVLEPRAWEEKELWETWACERWYTEELTWRQ